ncbi:MAG: phosphatase PAP2 family protein [Thermoleophilia bacterium]
MSTLGALGVNQVASRLWPRPRPFLDHAAVLLLPPSRDPSFPSDHAAFAFAAAVVLFLTSRRAGGAALTFAALAALSRVFVGEHYPLDVVSGALVGSIVALGLHTLRGRLEPVFALILRVARRAHLA